MNLSDLRILPIQRSGCTTTYEHGCIRISAISLINVAINNVAIPYQKLAFVNHTSQAS